jgi:membrane protease YdiL (CAAX protease family)
LNNQTEDHSRLNSGEPAPIDQVAPAKSSTLHKVFIGKDGLRAGWSLLIFIAFFAAIAFCVNVIGHKLHAPALKPGLEISPLFGLLIEGLNFLVVVVITWIMSRIERRPVSVYGFGDKRKLAHFFAGLAWGVSCLSLLVLTLWKAGLLAIDTRRLFGSEILRYGAVWLLGFLLVGLFEEYFTRGYLQYTLTRGLAGLYQWAFKTRHSSALGFWTSAAIFSILFGLSHNNNPNESPIGLLSAGLVAMVFCLSLWRTGSLWWAIGFHVSWDWAQSFLYGVPDSGLVIQHHLLATHPVGKPILSGGTTGPEGSIFIVTVLALVTCIILLTLPRTKISNTREYSARFRSIEN